MLLHPQVAQSPMEPPGCRVTGLKCSKCAIYPDNSLLWSPDLQYSPTLLAPFKK